MKRSLLNTLLGLGLIAASASASAGDWKFLPVLDSQYKPDVTLSVTGGSLSGTDAGSGNKLGAEIAVNCLAMQPPIGVIRSKISYGTFDHNGLKMSSFEINPHWTTSVAKDVTVGFGPGIGWVKTDVAGNTVDMSAFQLGADVDYRIGSFNVGVGARWQATAKKDIAFGVTGANNTVVQAKVGINF